MVNQPIDSQAQNGQACKASNPLDLQQGSPRTRFEQSLKAQTRFQPTQLTASGDYGHFS
jgi:hypothetical protein